MKPHILLLGLLLMQIVKGQDISGEWQGTADNEQSDIRVLAGIKYDYRLVIAADGVTITGTVMMTLGETEQKTGFRREHKISGVWSSATGLMTLQVEGLRELRSGREGAVMNGQSTVYRMRFRQKKKEDILEGRQAVDTVKMAIFPQQLRLTRKKQDKPPPQNIEATPPTAATMPVFETRLTDTLQVLYMDSTTITIDVYDNGEVDGDTVSLFLNNRLLLHRQALGTAPVTLRLQLDTNLSVHELKMYAENLGAIPPNTAIMVIRQGTKRWEAAMSADLHRNGSVLLKLGR